MRHVHGHVTLPMQLPSVGTDPWASKDGRPVSAGGIAPGAPSGTPQYPTLLNHYPTSPDPNARVRWPAPDNSSNTQPKWMVAGVDYYVGIDQIAYPTFTVPPMNDPNTFFGVGGPSFSIDDVNGRWLVAGTVSAVVEGVDFRVVRSTGALAGQHFTLAITNTGTTRVSNCYFGYRMSGFTPRTFCESGAVAGSVTFTQNIVNGLGINTLDVEGAFCLNMNNGGTSTFTYNWFTNNQGSPLSVGGNTTLIFKYNLMDTPSGFQPPLHSHCFQNTGPTNQNWSIDIEFNTVRWQSMPTFASQMWQLYNQTGAATVTLNNPICNNNTMIALNTNDAPVAWAANHSYSVGDSITGASVSGSSKYYWAAVATSNSSGSIPPAFAGNVSSISIGSPAVVTTSQPHNYTAGQIFYFWAGATLPTDISQGVALSMGEGQVGGYGNGSTPGQGLGQYFVLAAGLTATSFRFAGIPGSTTAINTSGSFSGPVWINPIIDGGVQWCGNDPTNPNPGAVMSAMIQGPGTVITVTGTKQVLANHVDFIGTSDYVAGVNNGHNDFTHLGLAAEFPGFDTISIPNIDMRDGTTITVRP